MFFQVIVRLKRYAFFEDLGSYTLFHLIKDTTEAHYFMKNYIGKTVKIL